MAYGALANDLRSRATRLRNIEISVAGKGLRRYDAVCVSYAYGGVLNVQRPR